MKICPISYTEIPDNILYAKNGLSKLSHRLEKIHFFDDNEIRGNFISNKEQIVTKGSLKISKNCFIRDEKKGKYLLKLQFKDKEYLPENEDISLRIAKTVNIEVPTHGLIYTKNNNFILFVRSPITLGGKSKPYFKSLAEILRGSSSSKKVFSYEGVIPLLDEHTTFPLLEKIKLFKILLFSFLTGNNTLDLTNIALLKKDNNIQISPLFCTHNAFIYKKIPEQEFGLSLNKKITGFNKNDLITYFAKEQLNLNNKVISKILMEFNTAIDDWFLLLEKCFLPQEYKESYYRLLNNRLETLQL